ncbi:agmatine deiminase family protein [Leisingera caerulea]|uniref:agmatine deiminase family protein n=1 Tax=Leisingera caerulea TaxID=506591 RepID=UPI003F4ABC71
MLPERARHLRAAAILRFWKPRSTMPGCATAAGLERLFPGRKTVGVDSTFTALDGGGIGCITQQQPAGSLAAP